VVTAERWGRCAPVSATADHCTADINVCALCEHRGARLAVWLHDRRGLLLSLVDFVLDIYRDPMPPITKLEHTRAMEDRRRRIVMYGWLLMAALLWGAIGCYWLGGSSTCARTAPSIYRLALLINILYGAAVACLTLAVIGLGIDFCASGKLRMIVVLEQ